MNRINWEWLKQMSENGGLKSLRKNRRQAINEMTEQSASKLNEYMSNRF